MFGNFTYCNPTKLYFGEDALNGLNTELPKYGKNVVLIYGGGSIKKNGIYDEVIKILKDNGKNVAEISGVMPNPTAQKLREGAHIALFFVKGEYHGRGIGSQLFKTVLQMCPAGSMTVNSSPCAVPIYHHLGFHDMDKEQAVNGLRFTPMEWRRT